MRLKRSIALRERLSKGEMRILNPGGCVVEKMDSRTERRSEVAVKNHRDVLGNHNMLHCLCAGTSGSSSRMRRCD